MCPWSGFTTLNLFIYLMLNTTMKRAICQECNLEFILSNGSFGKFCSLSCGTKYRNKVNKEASIKKYQLNPTNCNCCQTPLEYDKRKNKYCSQSCAAKITNKTPRKRGPQPIEKHPCSKVKFILCKHTNQYYSNRNLDGSIRRCSPYIKTLKEKYYSASRFRFNIYHYPEEFDLELIEKYGWYTCPGKKRKKQPKNISGVSRDHIISVSYGFANNIDSKIISHPANCRIILHSENKVKSGKCDITFEELLERIKLWEEKYTERDNGIEPMTKDWKSLVLPLN